jgi:hypothetical protein
VIDEKKSPNIEELNRMYSDGESCDKDLYAEMRSNILLSSGEHYSKKNSKWLNRLRDSSEIQSDQKLRLTKNHTHRITRTYENNIMAQAPGVIPVPNNPKELKDQKSAELNKSVWEYAKTSQHLRMKTHSWCKDFIEIGECITKIYWDPMAGELKGYEQAVSSDGVPEVDETGQPASSGKAVFTGDLVFERVLGFNLIRPAEAKTIVEAKWLCIRKMVGVKELKALLADDEEKQKKIVATQDETFFVFDGSKGNYSKSENEALIKEFYFRPCYDFPEGWFAIVTGNTIIADGPLPFGVFPLVYEGFDEIQTTPRHRSIIKQLRPYQYEINRAGSKIAEHQVTLGDDKVILNNGAKITSGPNLPGIRSMFVTGQEPTILPGRAGNQFFEYVASQIAEMYQVAGVVEDTEPVEGGDAFANLYRSIRNKKKFAIYAEKFENFLVNVCRTYLELAKQYFDEETLIPKIGTSEYINIAEFKSQEKLCYQIKIEPMSEDPTTMMGRHLVMNQILQYAGAQLTPENIGNVIKQMPFANHEAAFSDLTLDADSATNLILSLDRNEEPFVSKNDDGEYMLKKLASRQKQADYRMLSPEIQARYDQVIQNYEDMGAQKMADLKKAQDEFLPASGASIKCDYYVTDPTQPNRSIRATVPAEALDWLIKRLAEQGSSQEQLAMQTTQVQSEIANKFTKLREQQQPTQPQPTQGMGEEQQVQGGLLQ